MDEHTKAPLTFDEAGKFLLWLLDDTYNHWRKRMDSNDPDNVSSDYFLQFMKDVSNDLNQLNQLRASIEYWQSVYKK